MLAILSGPFISVFISLSGASGSLVRKYSGSTRSSVLHAEPHGPTTQGLGGNILATFEFCFSKESLPGRQRRDWDDSALDMVERCRLASHHCFRFNHARDPTAHFCFCEFLD